MRNGDIHRALLSSCLAVVQSSDSVADPGIRPGEFGEGKVNEGRDG